MASRFKNRLERNKQILGYLIAEIKYAQKPKNRVEDIVNYIRPFIEIGIIRAGWTWADIIAILFKIHSKMVDLGKNEEFMKIFNGFNSEYNFTYSNWAFKDVILLFSRLVVNHIDIMETIFDEYVKEDEKDEKD